MCDSLIAHLKLIRMHCVPTAQARCDSMPPSTHSKKHASPASPSGTRTAHLNTFIKKHARSARNAMERTRRHALAQAPICTQRPKTLFLRNDLNSVQYASLSAHTQGNHICKSILKMIPIELVCVTACVIHSSPEFRAADNRQGSPVIQCQ